MNVRVTNRLPSAILRLARKAFVWVSSSPLILLSAALCTAQPAASQHRAPIQRAAPPMRSVHQPFRAAPQTSPYAGGRPMQSQPAGNGPQRGFYGQNGGTQQERPRNEGSGQLINPNRPGQTQQHLGSWMQSHSNLPLDQQQRALEQEPGFHQLPPEQQQRMRDRLTQLNRMDPARRQSMIERTEAMERLNPQQRQQVRSAAGQLGSLPPERQRAVAQAFRGLQSMPPAQRQNYMNSAQFHNQFSDQERGTLNSLMQVSPYLPLRRPAGTPQ